MHTTQWREFDDHGGKMRIRAMYGFRQHGNQEPYFSVTGEIEGWQGARWEGVAGGCLHDEIAKHFPELAKVIRWHLCTLSGGPMHYIENAVYFWNAYRTPGLTLNVSEKIENARSFHRHVVMNALATTISLSNPDISTDDLKRWLEERLPELLKVMKADVDAIDHESMAPRSEEDEWDGLSLFVKRLGIQIKSKHSHGNRDGSNTYKVTLSRVDAGRRFRIETKFTLGAAYSRDPSAEEVMDCMISDARLGMLSFKDFCGDLGESEDSISARNTHRACVRSKDGLFRFLGAEMALKLAGG